MKRPAFQFYPKDWQGNAKLKRCKPAEKSYWLDVMCLMHDSEEYGVLRWPLREIANAVGCSASVLRGLAEKKVLKGSDDAIESFIYTPRHAGKDGEPVILLPAQSGPVWYCSRMVRDEYIRSKRGESTRFGDTPKEEPKGAPKPPFGDGPSSASASSPSGSTGPDGPVVPDGTGAPALPDCPHERIIALYHEILPMCPRVIEWHEARRTTLRTRWREKSLPNGTGSGYRTVDDGLAYWRQFFEFCAQSDWLTGKVQRKDEEPFIADLEWLIRPKNFTKVIEGRYHRGR